jgi:hypothetical protein
MIFTIYDLRIMIFQSQFFRFSRVNLRSSAVNEVEKTKPICQPSVGNPKH